MPDPEITKKFILDILQAIRNEALNKAIAACVQAGDPEVYVDSEISIDISDNPPTVKVALIDADGDATKPIRFTLDEIFG